MVGAARESRGDGSVGEGDALVRRHSCSGASGGCAGASGASDECLGTLGDCGGDAWSAGGAWTLGRRGRSDPKLGIDGGVYPGNTGDSGTFGGTKMD
jgi:hypothetical protein